MNAARDTTQPSQATAEPGGTGPAEQPARPLPLVDFSTRLTRLVEETTRPDGQRWTLSYITAACADRGVPVSRQYLAQLLNGERDEPRFSLIEVLADIFGVPAGYFAGDQIGRLITINDLVALLVSQRPAVANFLATHQLADVIASLEDPAVQTAVAAAIASGQQHR